MVAETFDYFKGYHHKVKHIRMDNARENQAVERLCKSQNITLEYTPPDTLNLNHIFERGLQSCGKERKFLFRMLDLSLK